MKRRTLRPWGRALRVLALSCAVLLLALQVPGWADHVGRLSLEAVQDHVDDLSAGLAALTPPELCDRGVLESGRGCVPTGRFRDNGDGTFTDIMTGLRWLQKTNDGSANDAGILTTFTAGPSWSDPSMPTDGGLFTFFLPGIDGAAGLPTCPVSSTCTVPDEASATVGTPISCAAPPADGCWRIPEADELMTLGTCSLDQTFSQPCPQPIDSPRFYWSLTRESATSPDVPNRPLIVNLDGLLVFPSAVARRTAGALAVSSPP